MGSSVLEEELVCVKNVDTKIVDDALVIQFNFENGKTYSEEIELEDESGDDKDKCSKVAYLQSMPPLPLFETAPFEALLQLKNTL